MVSIFLVTYTAALWLGWLLLIRKTSQPVSFRYYFSLFSLLLLGTRKHTHAYVTTHSHTHVHVSAHTHTDMQMHTTVERMCEVLGPQLVLNALVPKWQFAII